MASRVLVTLAMLVTGALVLYHAEVPQRVRSYVAKVRAGEAPTGEDGFTLAPGGAKWLLAWVVLTALELAAVDASPESGRVAALFSLLVMVSAAYQFLPEWGEKEASNAA